MYDNFVEEIDAIDNGVNQFDGESRYKISTNLSARVGQLNPKWNEDKVDENVCIEKSLKSVRLYFVLFCLLLRLFAIFYCLSK